MKKITLILMLVFVSLLSNYTYAEEVDVLDYMVGDYDYNGYTSDNSYLAITIHSYKNGEWVHSTSLPTCPEEFGSCEYTNWRGMGGVIRKKEGENILYFAKGIHQPGKTLEVFFYNEDSVYDFQEPYSRVTEDYFDTDVYGLFHNFYHLPKNNPYIEFPYRGSFWTKRYITSGEVTPWIHQVQVHEYKNMEFLRSTMFPYYYRINTTIHSNWDGHKNTWDNEPDTGNLPTPLEVLKLTNEWKNDAGEIVGGETYIYAKSGTNSFGIIKFERWEPRETVCGSSDCCTTDSCSGPLTLAGYNTFNRLAHYDEDENPDIYYQPSFYADPKLEVYPSEPSNGAFPRGAFELSGQGMTTDGTMLEQGDWMQLTEILTDGDWLLTPTISANVFCPEGYKYLGSFAPQNYIDHQTNEHGFSWAVLCGTNDNVLLATECPLNYESRGWFEAPTPETSAYDYEGNAVGGQKLNYCVHYNEFHYPKLDDTLMGDVNGDGQVNINDILDLITKFNEQTSDTKYDLNQDNMINVFDLVLVAKNIGE